MEGGFLQAVGSDTNLRRPRFDRTLIIHANVYDQDQGLTGRYHNTTLDTNQNNTSFILQVRGLEGSNTNDSAKATLSEYRHELNKFALRRLAKKQHRSKRQGLLPGSLLTTPGRRGLHEVVGALVVVAVVKGGIWLLDSTIWLQQPERRKKGEKG